MAVDDPTNHFKEGSPLPPKQDGMLKYRNDEMGFTVRLTLVVPVFNEEETVSQFMAGVNDVFGTDKSVAVDVLFVNDGSTDGTLSRILTMSRKEFGVKVIDLTRNFGKEAAITAGLEEASGDVIVPIDVDLQDPLELIPEMINKWREGNEVVLARRVSRASDSWAKRTSSNWFYRIHNRISKLQVPENVGDFRLLDRNVVEALKQLPESHRFMKGLFAWVGFRTAYVDYQRPERVAGTSKFNGWKLWNFALEGITSFSTGPLRIWTYLGFGVSALSLVFAIFVVLKVLIGGSDVPGYASIMVAVTFLGGLQLVGIGVIGEYLGRTYIESKRRPVYLVRRIYKSEENHGPEGK